jgi:hypothetical protein
MLLYRVGGPLRQISRVEGLYPQDTWSGARVTYTRLDCRGGSVAVTLQSDPALYSTPQTVTAFVGGREVGRIAVAPTAIRALTVPLRASGGRCVATFRVGRTKMPANDPRQLGIHFNRFSYRP